MEWAVAFIDDEIVIGTDGDGTVVVTTYDINIAELSTWSVRVLLDIKAIQLITLCGEFESIVN
ncbi:MAG: hypothetical protein JAY90_13195 [Candidatus Thiodiazotropha lotti]|nr:hypothetical protein [Candidatus Thiodiazotropha lotti]